MARGDEMIKTFLDSIRGECSYIRVRDIRVATCGIPGWTLRPLVLPRDGLSSTGLINVVFCQTVNVISTQIGRERESCGDI